MVQKRPFRDTQLLFKKKGSETPIFIVVFGCALSGPRCQKREILKSHPKKGKIWLITEKLFFGVFAVFLLGAFFFLFFCFCFFLFFCLFFCFCVFFGGFKGQVRWPEGPPHLALNPPCFFFFVFFVLRATSLGPKPSLFVIVVFVVLFFFWFCFLVV